MRAQLVLGLQLCRMVSQIESLKYGCPRLHRIWVPNTMEPRGKYIYIGFEVPKFPDPIPIYPKYDAHKRWPKSFSAVVAASIYSTTVFCLKQPVVVVTCQIFSVANE